MELGRLNLLSPAIHKIKNPHFNYNAKINAAVFAQTFDFFLAGSIWTHCDKKSIEIMLDGFVKYSNPTGVFLTSYLPAQNDEEDYQGDKWVGTSHESSIAGCIKHKRSWIKRECEVRNLIMEELPENAFDSQYWLKISKSSAVLYPSKLRRFLNTFRIKN